MNPVSPKEARRFTVPSQPPEPTRLVRRVGGRRRRSMIVTDESRSGDELSSAVAEAVGDARRQAMGLTQ